MMQTYRYARRHHEPWTAEEDSRLVGWLKGHPTCDRSLAVALGRTTRAVKNRAIYLRQIGRAPAVPPVITRISA